MAFSAETFRFLRELSAHNNREWFLENKPRYEEHVRAPAESFAAEVAMKLGLEPHVMRIYRDVRFSRDKSPYKTNIGVGFHRAGKVTEGAPGFYLHIAPGESFGAAGIWQPDPAVAARIRRAIANEPKVWFRARRGGLDDDENPLKRVPKGLAATGALADDLRHRSFTASTAFSDRQVGAKDFAKTYVACARGKVPLVDFLSKAIATSS
jgi:uncharacterized protein (TIGR02453 family)